MNSATRLANRKYDANFHVDRDARTRATARTILSYLFQKFEIKSVCDVGCGVGTWLAAARELGAAKVKGYEGPWAGKTPLVIEAELIALQDLEAELQDKQRFDLVVSLEVVEHLSADRGPGFVKDLCALGDLILFSAAIPDQGGTGHVNERWQSYWAGLFDQEEFDVFDVVRPAIWQDESVPWWYRQNTLVYARRGTATGDVLGQQLTVPSAYLDVVHPELFRHAEASQPLRALKKTFRSVLGRN